MTDSHPITPSLELVQQWRKSAPTARDAGATREVWIATQAARWGADQELEACCRLLNGVDIVPPDGAKNYPQNLFAARERISKLRAARRPKPSSLAEQALFAIDEEQADLTLVNYKVIRAALKRLKELEQND